MGVDMKFLPYRASEIASSFDVLNLERRRALWPHLEALELLHGRDVPDNFYSYMGRDEEGESCYGRTNQTPYGLPVKSVSAMCLQTLADNPSVQDNWRNRAVWAYLKELPNDVMVALYWC